MSPPPASIREIIESSCNLFGNWILSLIGLEATERPDTGGVFTGVSSDVQNDLIECLDDEIDKEISDCQFISIQCDETLDIRRRSRKKSDRSPPGKFLKSSPY